MKVERRGMATMWIAASLLAVAIAAVGIFAYYNLYSGGCQSTSCQQVSIGSPTGGSQQTQTSSTAGTGTFPGQSTTTSSQTSTTSQSTTSSQTSTTTGVPAETGTANLDVWADFTDGSTPMHFTKTASFVQKGSTITLGGHTIQDIRVQLVISFSPALPVGTTYSGSIDVYTCGACGNQQVYLGKTSLTGASTSGTFQATTFPALSPTGNLTLLVWPDTVTVSLNGGSWILGMSPVVITNAVVGGATTTAPPTPCPVSVQMLQLVNGQIITVGYAPLISAQQAQVVWSVSSYSGLLATYNLSPYTVTSVIVAGAGGPAGSQYALLSGYHYTSTGACYSS